MATQKGIYKRGNIYWIRYSGLDGQIRYESSGSTKLRDAQALLTTRRNSVLEGKAPDVKRIVNHTFREMAVRYIEWMEVRHKSAGLKKYLIGQLLEVFGNLPLRRMTPSVVKQFQTDCLKRDLKNSSTNKKISLLKAMMRWAVEESMVEQDVLDKLRKVKMLQDDSKRLRFLTVEESKALVAACEPYFRPVIITALMTGMRKREILNLCWDHVDLEHGFILLEPTTKNSERREIPIVPELHKTLESLPRYEKCPYVFPNKDTMLPYWSGDKPFAKALAKSEITNFHFHDLRHTYASHLVMSGIDLTTVMHLMGHKSIKMTLRYAHLAPSHKVKAMSAIEEKFQGMFKDNEENKSDTDEGMP